jgi:CcmD family protein
MAVAYGIVWLAVVLFVARMAVRQRKLQRSFESLRSQVEASQNDDVSRARAA